MTRVVRGTPEQIAQINELATLWRTQASHPLVAAGAAMTVMMNVLQEDVEPEDRPAVIEAWVQQLWHHFGTEG